MCINKQNNRGFTLVELSIVIIIIGFLIAGISAATSLIRQAALNSVISDFKSFQIGLNLFKDKYGAMPGDLTNAYYYFGANCGTNTEGDEDSCNGNGDGFIGTNEYLAQLPAEDLKGWKHLAMAGFISGNYTGVFADTRQSAGINVPASRLSGGGYRIGGINGTTWYNRSFNGNIITFAAFSPDEELYINSIMTPAEAKSLENKVDDDNPVTGNFMIFRGDEVWTTAGKCMTGGTNSGQAESLLLTDTSKSCTITMVGPELQSN